MTKTNIIKLIITLLVIILLLISNYYHIIFPTIYDTFSYLILGKDTLIGELTRESLHYSSLISILGKNIDLLLLNSFSTYLGYTVFLVLSYLTIKQVTNRKSSLMFVFIYCIFLFGSYRFFLGGFLQILIFIGINLSFLMQSKFKLLGKNKYLIINYIYLLLIATINDFGVLFLIFNILYNIKYIFLNKKGAIIVILIILLWGLLYLSVKNGFLLIEYPNNGKLKTLYNIILNPFTWGPGFNFPKEFIITLGGGVSGYIYLILMIGGLKYGKIILKDYVMYFVVFYSTILLILPEAPSFSRYISYFLPYGGLLIGGFLIHFTHGYKYLKLIGVFGGLSMMIYSGHILNEFLNWNNNGRYGLEYKIGKNFICQEYGNNTIVYGHFEPTFILGYMDAGCNKNNLIEIGTDFYNGTNPLKTIIELKPSIFFYSELNNPPYKFYEYLRIYLDNTDITLKMKENPKKLLDIFGKYKGTSGKVGIYEIEYHKKNIKYFEKNLGNVKNLNIKIPEGIDTFYIHAYLNNSKDELSLIDKNINVKLKSPYIEKNWNTVIFPVDNTFLGNEIILNYSGLGYFTKISYYTSTK